MARISERDAERMGIGSRAGTPSSRPGRTARPTTSVAAATSLRTRRPNPADGRLPAVSPADPGPIEFIVRTDPIPKGRARTHLPKGPIVKCFVQARGNLQAFQNLLAKVRHHSFTPDRTDVFEKEVAMTAARAMSRLSRRPIDIPVSMAITFVFLGDPGTWPTNRTDGDLDNLEKGVKDALNGIVYTDDRLVVETTKRKICGPEARIEISIAAATPAT